MRKQSRQQLIRRLLMDYTIQRQEDFVELLKAENVDVTQATISRDIKEMQLIKVPSHDGSFKYSLPQTTEPNNNDRLQKILQDAFVSMDSMDKYLLIHTIPGNGSLLGDIVEKNYKDILFTVITNDTKVLIICLTEKNVIDLKQQLTEML